MEVMAGRLKSSLGTLEKNSLVKKSISTLLHLMSKAAFFSYSGKGTFLVPSVPGETVIPINFLCFRWCRKAQVIDLRAEGYWEELMDTTQPKLVVKDW